MANIETLAADTRYFAEVAAPSTPASGQAVVYVKSDGKIYLKNDGGTETDLTLGSAGAEFSTAAAAVATEQTTTSTSYTDLATTGPAVTVTIGASGKAKVTVSAQLSNSNANIFAGVGMAVSGATTTAAVTYILSSGGANAPQAMSRSKVITGLAAGSTTFTLKYIAEANTAKFAVREIIVEPVL